jgi:hypothetical protein
MSLSIVELMKQPEHDLTWLQNALHSAKRQSAEALVIDCARIRFNAMPVRGGWRSCCGRCDGALIQSSAYQLGLDLN